MWLTIGQLARVVPAYSCFIPKSGFLQTEDHRRRMASSSKVSGSCYSNAFRFCSDCTGRFCFDLYWIYVIMRNVMKNQSYNLTLNLPGLQTRLIILFAGRDSGKQFLIFLFLLLIIDFFQIAGPPPLELVRVHWVLMKLGRQSCMLIPHSFGPSVIMIILF
jgi:hypothetical protein